MTPTTRESGWTPFLLAAAPMLVGLILSSVLERLAPNFAHLALPMSIAFGTPPILIFARKLDVRASCGVMAIMMLYYGWREPIAGEYGTWQIVPFVLVLTSLASLGIRYLPWWSWPATTFCAVFVGLQAFKHIRDPFIFPMGFVILGALLVLKSRAPAVPKEPAVPESVNPRQDNVDPAAYL